MCALRSELSYFFADDDARDDLTGNSSRTACEMTMDCPVAPAFCTAVKRVSTVPRRRNDFAKDKGRCPRYPLRVVSAGFGQARPLAQLLQRDSSAETKEHRLGAASARGDHKASRGLAIARLRSTGIRNLT